MQASIVVNLWQMQKRKIFKKYIYHIILRNMAQFQGRKETREKLGSCIDI